MMLHKYTIYYFIETFNKEEINSLNKKINLIFRNYKKKFDKTYFDKVVEFCKKRNQKIFISNNVKIAKICKFNGLYIPSFNKNLNYKNLNFNKKFKLIGSAHNEKEILIKQRQGCEDIFVSPIFLTKKNKFLLGISRFNKINLINKKKIIALGGINQNNFKRIKLTKSQGIGSINWIKKNRPNFLGRF